VSLYRHWGFLSRVILSPQRRHLFRWIASRREGWNLETPPPSITFEAIDRIAAHLRDGMRAFEYGSGGSTLFWLKWKAELVSIEHDRERFELVKNNLPVGAQVEYRLVPPESFSEENLEKDPSQPDSYVSTDEASRGRTYRAYVTQIDAYPDDHFDVVIVAGRARCSCMWHAAPKVKPGGLLVLEDAGRDHYVARIGDRLSDFVRQRYVGIGPVNAWNTETDVFVRRITRIAGPPPASARGPLP
jgi:hypothetical protein